MKLCMRRTVHGRLRYYTLELIPNLFGEWILIRTYGSIKKLKPTRVIRRIYSDAHEAIASMDTIKDQKQKRGYEIQYPYSMT